MKIRFHRDVEKHYKNLRSNEKKKFKERCEIFLSNPYHSSLHNHPLRGMYEGYRSINISGDIRAIYRLIDNNTAYFVAIGRHHDLYE